MTFTQLLAVVQSGKVRVCADSRQVQPGDCFVAVRGTQTDGHRFIPMARQRGALYIVAEQADDSRCIVGGMALFHISQPTRTYQISYDRFFFEKKKKHRGYLLHWERRERNERACGIVS